MFCNVYLKISIPFNILCVLILFQNASSELSYCVVVLLCVCFCFSCFSEAQKSRLFISSSAVSIQSGIPIQKMRMLHITAKVSHPIKACNVGERGTQHRKDTDVPQTLVVHDILY